MAKAKHVLFNDDNMGARILVNPDVMLDGALVNPDLSEVRGISPEFWKLTSKGIVPMTQDEQDSCVPKAKDSLVHYQTIEKQVFVDRPVEVIKEVPVEVVREVEKRVEVIKEVPVEVIKEVEKLVEVQVFVPKEVEVIKEVEKIKEVIITNTVEVKVPVEVIKEVQVDKIVYKTHKLLYALVLMSILFQVLRMVKG